MWDAADIVFRGLPISQVPNTHAHPQIYIYLHALTYICMYVQCMYTCASIRINTHTHTLTHTLTHTHTQADEIQFDMCNVSESAGRNFAVADCVGQTEFTQRVTMSPVTVGNTIPYGIGVTIYFTSEALHWQTITLCMGACVLIWI